MNIFWISLILVIGHVSMALYGCLIIKDSFKLSAKTKKSLIIVCVLVPLIGFALAMTLAGKKQKSRMSDSGAFGAGGHNESSGCDGGGSGE